MKYEELLNYASDRITDQYYYERNKRKELDALSFGTGGIRASVGVGENELNALTVTKIMLDIAAFAENLNVLIFYDTRYASYPFAKLSTQILKAKNIKVSLASGAYPTPVLSYALQNNGYSLGLMFTASHNAYTDAGIKVYNQFGNQITDIDLIEMKKYMNHTYEEASLMLKSINREERIKTQDFSQNYSQYLQNNIAKITGKEEVFSKTKVVFSPLHGVGAPLIPKITEALEFIELNNVDAQLAADGFFSTVSIPNPESLDSFDLAKQLTLKTESELIVLTDADSDRIGLAEYHNEKFRIFNGNEIGILIFNFLIDIQWNKLKGSLMYSVVSSDLPGLIAKEKDIHAIKTLTGFKYIGERMNQGYDLFFGFEESGGYLIFDQVKDKDGVQAALVAMAMKSFYKKKGLTLSEVLENIYVEYGYFKTELDTFENVTINWDNDYNYLLEKGVMIEDYNSQKIYKNQKTQDFTDYPKTKMVKVYLDSYNWFAIRPSGTENKLKIYYQAQDFDKNKNVEKLIKLKEISKQFIKETT